MFADRNATFDPRAGYSGTGIIVSVAFNPTPTKSTRPSSVIPPRPQTSSFRLSPLPLYVITSLLPLSSLKPRGPPNHHPATHQQPQTHQTQNDRRPQMESHLRHSRHPSEKHKHAGRRHNKDQIPSATLKHFLSRRSPSIHPRLHIIRRNAVAHALALSRLFPPLSFRARRRRKRDRSYPQHHQQRPTHHLPVGRSPASMQLPENQNAPKQSPNLIRIRQRNPAANPHILRRILLKQIPNHPNKSPQHQPKQNLPRTHKLTPQPRGPGKADRQSPHHPHFSKRKKCHKRQRIHPRQISLPIRDIHRPPQNPRPQSRSHAARSMRSRTRRSRRRSHRQHPSPKTHHQNSTQHASPSPPARPSQLIEKNKSPQNAQQAIRIPQRKRNTQPHIPNRKNRQSVRHRPNAPRQNCPDNQMRRPPNIRAN